MGDQLSTKKRWKKGVRKEHTIEMRGWKKKQFCYEKNTSKYSVDLGKDYTFRTLETNTLLRLACCVSPKMIP